MPKFQTSRIWKESRGKRILKIAELEHALNLDLKQRARIKWAIEGEENSKFFHGLLNQNRRSNFIHGVSISGVWIMDPSEIKVAAHNLFSIKFSDSCHSRPSFINKF